jgi:hypothetical protein
LKSETAIHKLMNGGALMPIESLSEEQVPADRISVFCPRCNEMDICECHEWDGDGSDAVHNVWFMCFSCGYKSERKVRD